MFTADVKYNQTKTAEYMIKKIIGAAMTVLVLGGGAASASAQHPATASSTDATVLSMQQIHEQSAPEALAKFNDPTAYAANVPPASQGVAAKAAADQNITVDQLLHNILNSFYVAAVPDPTMSKLQIDNPWRPAQAPVGDAKLSEYGFLSGSYVACARTAMKITDGALQTYRDNDDGQVTWPNYGMTWEHVPTPDTTDDPNAVTFVLTLYRATDVATASPTTIQPAPPPTTVPAEVPIETVAVDLPPAPAPTMSLPTGGTGTPDQAVAAQQCLDGDMVACDTLYDSTLDSDGSVIAGQEAYNDFADRCAGRQLPNSGHYCEAVFASTHGAAPAPQEPTGTQPPAAPSTTAPSAQNFTVVGAANDICAPQAVKDWFANRDKHVDPQSAARFQGTANDAELSLHDYVTELIDAAYDAASDTAEVLVPFQTVTPNNDGLYTEMGLLEGVYLNCMANILNIPDDASFANDGTQVFGNVTVQITHEKLSEDSTVLSHVLRFIGGGA